MSYNVIFMGWSRPVPGREALSAEHFQEVLQDLGAAQQAGTIQSFQAVLLNPHGGDLNGFVLVQGESSKLDAYMASEEFQAHSIRAGLYLEGFGIVRGATGELLMEQMGRWAALIPT